MVLYVPDSVKSGSKAPTLMWYVLSLRCRNVDVHALVRIHGGSFTFGSANGPGLDGSKLATATNSIVAVIQYRLGAVCTSLALMSPAFIEEYCSWVFTHRAERPTLLSRMS